MFSRNWAMPSRSTLRFPRRTVRLRPDSLPLRKSVDAPRPLTALPRKFTGLPWCRTADLGSNRIYAPVNEKLRQHHGKNDCKPPEVYIEKLRSDTKKGRAQLEARKALSGETFAPGSKRKPSVGSRDLPEILDSEEESETPSKVSTISPRCIWILTSASRNPSTTFELGYPLRMTTVTNRLVR